MHLKSDPDMQKVLMLMQEHITAAKLVAVAERLPEMARLLWGHIPQEPCIPLEFALPKMVAANQSLPVSIESALSH